MKSVLIALIIIINSAYPLWSQGGDESIPFVAYWNKGDSHDFKITKIKKMWRGDLLVRNDTFVQLVNFQVVDSTEAGYTIRWKINQGGQVDIPARYQSIMGNRLFDEIMYTTDESGVFADLLNWEEIAVQFKSEYEGITDLYLEENGINKDSFHLIMNPILNLFKSKEAVENFMLSEIKMMHFPFGLAIPLGKPFEYNEELATAFGSGPVRADAKIYVDSLDEETAFCVFVQQLQSNPKDTRRMLEAFYSKMNLNSKEAARELKKAVDNNRFAYYYYPGIPYHIETIRETHVSITDMHLRRFEKATLELIANK